MNIKLYTDGACSKNGSKNNFGGYSIILTADDKPIKIYKKGKSNTTNNEMEMIAVLQAIKLAKILSKNTNKIIEIFSDSAYVVNTINDWMIKWALKGWKKNNNKSPENLSLVKEIYDLMQFENKIKIVKIKGHADNKFNELADKYAKEAVIELKNNYLNKEE